MTGMTRDPHLRRTNTNLATYIDIFVNNFLGLAQGSTHGRRQVQQTLFHSLYKVFLPCNSVDSANSKELLLIKKLRKGGYLWSTCQVLLGWLIDMVNMIFSSTSHRENRFKEILSEITTSQKRIVVDKWHQVLGELHSMPIALPGVWGLFRYMKEDLHHVEGKGWC